MDHSEFFMTTFGSEPFTYQARLALEPWPSLVNVPTGLGKTAAVTLAWLYKRLHGDPDTPRRLVYCLPMRVLVEQTCENVRQWLAASRPLFEARALVPPTLHVLMGGQAGTDWVGRPEDPAIIIGTQDMLLSRALMRGYGMSRYAWPMHFALLHNDALWVFDEVQLMGPALATSAQLEGFRRQPGMAPVLPARSLWLSATLNRDWLDTVDLRPHLNALTTLALTAEEQTSPSVRKRREAAKRLRPARTRLEKGHGGKSGRKAYAEALANEVLAAHGETGDTLVVVNTVERAQAIYEALAAAGATEVLLIHARFRAHERAAIERRLKVETGARRIIVATQAIEAGVDITSTRLFTELAPWTSLVQRFGRCNRYGEVDSAEVFWIDFDDEDALTPPYETASLAPARDRLKALTSTSPADLPPTEEPRAAGQVLRRKDLLELFNTDPDLSGFDIDVSPYIRDAGTPQLQVFWREVTDRPADDEPGPGREELCPVSISQLNEHLGNGKRAAYVWDSLMGRWQPLQRPIPGMTVMLRAGEGGYDPQSGFVAGSKAAVAPVEADSTTLSTEASYGGDEQTQIGRFVGLTEHLVDVADEARALAEALALDGATAQALVMAGRWHDVGKAHPAFQNALKDYGTPREHGEALWAKSPGGGPLRYRTDAAGQESHRPRFRHELASMLAWLEHGEPSPTHDLIAYLIAAHHGKVRMGLRALPEEREPPEAGRRFARGVWEGDRLPAIRLNGHSVPETTLRLAVMELGAGEQGPSWSERSHRLLAEHGPFRLAWLETLVRIADWRASEKEAKP